MNATRWIVLGLMVVAASTLGQAPDRNPDRPGDGTGNPPESGGPQSGEPGLASPSLTPAMQQELARLREQRQHMLQELQAVLDAYVNASEPERRAAVEAWREANADALAEQVQASQELRIQAREHVQAARPENPGPAGSSTEPVGEADMEQRRQQARDATQAREQLSQELRDATQEEQQQLVAQQREQRMEQVQQDIEQTQERARQMNREASMASLREQLQEEAEMLRTQEREQARQDVKDQQELAQQVRQTSQERVQEQAQERLDQPERPDRPETPVQPDRPDRPDRPERIDSAGGGAGDDAEARRDQLMEQVQIGRAHV